MKKLKFSKGQIVLISGILAGISFGLYKLLYNSSYNAITITIMMIATVIAGFSIFRNAISALRYRIVGIDALVSIAVVGAIIIGEYWEATAVTFLFMLGDFLEARTIEKTRSSIKALLDLAPDTARVRRDNQEIEISPDDVVVGDLVIVKQGEKIAVDGIIVQGSAHINQSAITGESMPISRSENQNVFSGTIIESGYLVVKAEKVGEDTTFARILQMVEEAQDKKAKTQKFLEKFSRYYTPAIILITIIVFAITRDITMSLTLLVIACPGALVISAPVSVVAGIGNGAKNGVLVKGGEIMEKLGSVKVVAFDKTGTLTMGKPSVTKIKTFGMDENELLRIARIGESYSEHPLAKAIISKADEVLGKSSDNITHSSQNLDSNQVVSNEPQDTTIITGQGIKFGIQNTIYYIGNNRLMADNNIATIEYEDYIQSQEMLGQTAVIVSDDKNVLGIISIADTVREDAKTLVHNLKKLGIKKVVMLTGDNELSAKYIANQTGIDEYYSQLLPQDKVKALQDLQQKYGRVAMVGDGVNDAPALASADLGVAIGGVGSDVAMETADVVLMSAEVGKLSYAVGLSRATVRNMKQNIIFALIVAGVLLAGVLVKTVNLALGMLVHELSVILVVVNAVRLLYYKKFSKKSPKNIKM